MVAALHAAGLEVVLTSSSTTPRKGAPVPDVVVIAGWTTLPTTDSSRVTSVATSTRPGAAIH